MLQIWYKHKKDALWNSLQESIIKIEISVMSKINSVDNTYLVKSTYLLKFSSSIDDLSYVV